MVVAASNVLPLNLVGKTVEQGTNAALVPGLAGMPTLHG